MKSIITAFKRWRRGEDFWLSTTSINPVCYSPWWVMKRTKEIVHPEFVAEFYSNFWSSRLR